MNEEDKYHNIRGVLLMFLVSLFLTKRFKPQKKQTISKYIKECGFSVFRKDVRMLLTHLIDKDILVEYGEDSFGYGIYYINKKELEKLIDSQPNMSVYDKYYDYKMI